MVNDTQGQIGSSEQVFNANQPSDDNRVRFRLASILTHHAGTLVRGMPGLVAGVSAGIITKDVFGFFGQEIPFGISSGMFLATISYGMARLHDQKSLAVRKASLAALAALGTSFLLPSNGFQKIFDASKAYLTSASNLSDTKAPANVNAIQAPAVGNNQRYAPNMSAVIGCDKVLFGTDMFDTKFNLGDHPQRTTTGSIVHVGTIIMGAPTTQTWKVIQNNKLTPKLLTTKRTLAGIEVDGKTVGYVTEETLGAASGEACNIRPGTTPAPSAPAPQP